VPRAIVDDEEFIRLFTTLGGAQTAKRLNIGERAVYHRRRALEKKYDRPIHSPHNVPTDCHPERREFELENGIILIGSDAHYWPGIVTTAHRAFVKFVQDMKPKAVVLNGDVMDGASISRHPPSGYEDRPMVVDEMNACKERMFEIQDASKNAKLFWTMGNHDARFEGKLASSAPEFKDIKGTQLSDHFPDWLFSWSLFVNKSVMIKHRWKGGVHATHNNALQSGCTMVTGHLHSLKVTPWADYTGTRWGVDTGTLADVSGPQFLYAEDNPRNWRSGFAVLKFDEGILRWPELVHVVEPGIVEFRGETIKV